MKKHDFERCCQYIERGGEVFVMNSVSKQRGHVLFCTSDRLHVDIDGRKDSWLPQVCENDRSSSH